jgi:hypothetical protein
MSARTFFPDLPVALASMEEASGAREAGSGMVRRFRFRPAKLRSRACPFSTGIYTDALIKADAHLGLLVSLNNAPLSVDRIAPTIAIVTISLDELERSGPQTLRKQLAQARNNLVHGF